MPAVTVVVPTRDRPIELSRCLRALQGQETAVAFEIVVVDDGSTPAIRRPAFLSDGIPLMVIRCDGSGPAHARNVGVRHARGPVILFTDDDTVPAPQWIEAASSFLAMHQDYVGVEGPTNTPSYDPLYFHSVRASAPGSFLTCNVAYRRAAIEDVGGFSEIFPFAHAEDLDLGFRIARLGPVGFEPQMAVLHPPMRTSLMSEIQRGKRLVSDGHLFRRHPERYKWTRYLSATGYALGLNAKHWAYSAIRDQYQIGRSPRRALRFFALAVGYSTVGAVAIVRDWGRRRIRGTTPQPSRPESRGGQRATSHH